MRHTLGDIIDSYDRQFSILNNLNSSSRNTYARHSKYQYNNLNFGSKLVWNIFEIPEDYLWLHIKLDCPEDTDFNSEVNCYFLDRLALIYPDFKITGSKKGKKLLITIRNNDKYLLTFSIKKNYPVVETPYFTRLGAPH